MHDPGSVLGTGAPSQVDKPMVESDSVASEITPLEFTKWELLVSGQSKRLTKLEALETRIDKLTKELESLCSHCSSYILYGNVSITGRCYDSLHGFFVYRDCNNCSSSD